MKSTDSLESWLTKLLGVEKFRPGLDRLIPIFESYKKIFRERGIRIVTIGGTNGKGETSFSLEKLLHHNGVSTALWTSPHIMKVNERFVFSGEEVSSEDLLEVLESNHSMVNQLSYYEYLFKCFCDLVVKREKVEVVILEVGLGGRLDTVNLFDADLCAITSIARDHEEFLGNTLAKILNEKLGITRAEKTCVYNLEKEVLQNQANDFCQENNIIGVNFRQDILEGSENYSVQNKMMASYLKSYILECAFTPEDDLIILKDLQLKGRMESFQIDDNILIFNGAHNIDGMRKLRDRLVASSEKFDEIIFAPSLRKQSDIIAMAKVLKSAKCLYNELKVTTFEDHPRAIKKEDLLQLINDLSYVDWKEELINKKGKRILLTGSYYFIGEVQKYFNL